MYFIPDGVDLHISDALIFFRPPAFVLDAEQQVARFVEYEDLLCGIAVQYIDFVFCNDHFVYYADGFG